MNRLHRTLRFAEPALWLAFVVYGASTLVNSTRDPGYDGGGMLIVILLLIALVRRLRRVESAPDLESCYPPVLRDDDVGEVPAVSRNDHTVGAALARQDGARHPGVTAGRGPAGTGVGRPAAGPLKPVERVEDSIQD